MLGLKLYPPSASPELAGLDDDEKLEAMTEWFSENFEDPVHSMPHDEGEYVYIWGGPYDAGDELSDAFGGDATHELIERAVAAVESSGVVDWAPHERRVMPEVPDVEPSSPYDAMQARLAEAAEILKNLDTPNGPFGHNNPPPEAQILAISTEDRDKILSAINALSAAPESVSEVEATSAKANLSALSAQANKLAAWIQANVVNEAGKTFGKTIGVTLAGGAMAALSALVVALVAAANAGFTWLASLPWHLISPL